MAPSPAERRANFLAWMEREHTNVLKVSERAGIHRNTLYGFARGDAAKMSAVNEAKIATAYETTTAAIFEGKSERLVGVRGLIGARAEVLPINDSFEAAYEIPLPPGLNETEDYEAFEVEGISMPPARPGWTIIFRKRPLPLSELVGFPCLIELEDGRRLFKVLRKGYAPDRWNLESWDGSPLIEDVRITAALPFAAMTPGKMAR